MRVSYQDVQLFITILNALSKTKFGSDSKETLETANSLNTPKPCKEDPFDDLTEISGTKYNY